jgi:hypothetical protein
LSLAALLTLGSVFAACGGGSEPGSSPEADSILPGRTVSTPVHPGMKGTAVVER